MVAEAPGVVAKVARWHSQVPLHGVRVKPGLAEAGILVYMATLSSGLLVLGLMDVVQVVGFVLAPALFAAVALILHRRNTLEGTATHEDQAFREEGASGHLVAIKVLQNEMVTGQDRGILLFEPGALVFSGHRTSFVLKAQNIGPCRAPRDKRRPSPLMNDEFELCLDGPGGSRSSRNVSLQIRPLCEAAGARTPQQMRIRERVDAALSMESEIEPEFPPLQIGPGGITKYQSITRLFLSRVGLIAVLMSLVVGVGARDLFASLLLLPLVPALWIESTRSARRFDALRFLLIEDGILHEGRPTTILEKVAAVGLRRVGTAAFSIGFLTVFSGCFLGLMSWPLYSVLLFPCVGFVLLALGFSWQSADYIES